MEQQEKLSLIKLAKTVAILGGVTGLKYFRQPGLQIKNKLSNGFDPVTEADQKSEDKMRSYIKNLRPNDGIVGEEQGISSGTSGFTWFLDPIDGTRAFISGIPVWTVLVSVSKDGQPVLGVVYQPFTQEFFIGGLGFSEYTRNHLSIKLSVRQCKSLEAAFLSTTFPEIGTALERKAFQAVAMRVRLCRYGLDAYAYALLAAGHLDLVIEAGLKPYDVHAPIALIEAAGGIVTNWSGGPAVNGGQIMACGDESIHQAALAILSKKSFNQ